MLTVFIQNQLISEFVVLDMEAQHVEGIHLC